MTEKEYRAVNRDSSSSLADFAKDRRKYYRKYVLGEKVAEKPNKASDMGRLVETLLMEEDRFDELFFMSSVVKPPGGMTGDFIYHLAKEVSDYAMKEGISDHELSEDTFEGLARKAYKTTGFKIKFETVLSKLFEPENEIFYQELLLVMVKGMSMVTVQDIDNADRIVNNLRENHFVGPLMTLESDSTFEVINQLKIIDYEIDGLELKSMLDKIIINNVTKTIHIIDLKCTWNVEKFYKEYYLFRKAYIQGYLYYTAVLSLTKSKSSPYYGYTVETPEFIVCDSINYYDPLRYKMSEDDLKKAYKGFEEKNTYYPGVKEIISNIKWARENDKWGISRENHFNRGIVKLGY